MKKGWRRGFPFIRQGHFRAGTLHSEENQMLDRSQEAMTGLEIARMDQRLRGNWFTEFLKREVVTRNNVLNPLTEVYHVVVEKCFIPDDFNDELPLYLLQAGDIILILFGQWLYDPHILFAPDGAFQCWDSDGLFFKHFTIRWSTDSGIVFNFVVRDKSFIKSVCLPNGLRFTALRECQVISGHGETIIDDLRKANLIE